MLGHRSTVSSESIVSMRLAGLGSKVYQRWVVGIAVWLVCFGLLWSFAALVLDFGFLGGLWFMWAARLYCLPVLLAYAVLAVAVARSSYRQ